MLHSEVRLGPASTRVLHWTPESPCKRVVTSDRGRSIHNMKNTIKCNAITAKFITTTRVELNCDGDIAVIEALNPASARLLAALVEADLVDLCGDKVYPRTAKMKPMLGDRTTTEQRHGIRMQIVERHTHRELVAAEDLVHASALN